MEWSIRAKGVSVGNVRPPFAALRGRLAQRGQGIVRAAWRLLQASNEVWAHRRRERETFGAIGLGGRGFLG